MDIREMLVMSDPELERYIQTNQYKLSKTILKIRVKLSLSPQKIAEKLSIPFEEYLELESGDEHIDVERYNQIIDQMISILNKNEILKVSRKVNKDIKYSIEGLKETVICINNKRMLKNSFKVEQPQKRVA